MRSSDNQEAFRVELKLLHVEMSQMIEDIWLGCLLDAFQRRCSRHFQLRRDLRADTRCWRDYISQLAWECLRLPQKELKELAREREAWVALLSLLPLQTCPR